MVFLRLDHADLLVNEMEGVVDPSQEAEVRVETAAEDLLVIGRGAAVELIDTPAGLVGMMGVFLCSIQLMITAEVHQAVVVVAVAEVGLGGALQLTARALLKVLVIIRGGTVYRGFSPQDDNWCRLVL